jgi:uncharacterized protein (DUF1330 family)
MTVAICVLLWARPGCEQLLADYENQVLALLSRHEGKVLSRVRALDNGLCEIQIREFASDQALLDFQEDPKRLALSALRDQAIERTRVIRVEHVRAPE